MIFFLKKNWRGIILGLCALIFFFVYQFLSLAEGWAVRGGAGDEPVHVILNQPDELATYQFLRHLAVQGEFGIAEPLWLLSDGTVRPRSTTIVHGRLVPIGFPLFFVLYGYVMHVVVLLFGDQMFNQVAAALTPLLGALTAPLVYYVGRRVFPKDVAFTAALLLFIAPPWWYYASRAFQHHTAMLFFLITALALLPRKRQRQPISFAAFASGLAFGLAVSIRPSESVWMSLVYLAAVFYNYRLHRARDWIAGSLGVACMAFLFFAVQNAVYADPFGTGYAVPQGNAAGRITDTTVAPFGFSSLFAPFGFDAIVIAKNIYHYLGSLFYVWTAATVFGFLMILFRLVHRKKEGNADLFQAVLKSARALFRPSIMYRKRKDQRLFAYIWLLLITCVLLLIYYGSWSFFDNLSGLPSIGSSHTRYFLPIYIGSLPCIAYVIVRMVKSHSLLPKIVGVLLPIVLLVSSIQSVFFSFEGLQHIKQTVASYADVREAVYASTPADSIIVTRYADKYLFPERKIIPGFIEEKMYDAVGSLVKNGYAVHHFDLPLSEQEKPEFFERLKGHDIQFGDLIFESEHGELHEFQLIPPVAE
jgi:hypothetical protein